MSPNGLLIIPQFDILTLGAQIFGLLLTLSFFYYYNVNFVIPHYIETKKFRVKKLIKNTSSVTMIGLDLINNKQLIDKSYKLILK